MLSKEDLLTQDTKPLLREISLQLYKEFCTDILFKKRFHYYFEDGTDIIVECREWGVYHMLAIHHIDFSITKEQFFDKIDNGLTLSDFEVDNAIETRYKKYKERIALFSCLYQTLRYGRVFYLPSGDVPNTQRVKCDYLVYRQIGTKGMNVGMKYEDGCFVPMTNLVSRQRWLGKYIDTTTAKIVKQLIISNIESGEIEENILYTDDFILHQSL
ncbi:MAG: hypothetical protein ACI4TK_10520 [Agathobacter sp.]